MTQLSDFLGGRDMAEAYRDFWVPTALEPFGRDLAAGVDVAVNDILDLGCGTGEVTRYVAECVPASTNIVGIDPTPILLEAARARPGNSSIIEWVDGAGEDLPFEDASFDAIVCHQAMQYVTDRRATFAEAARVLRPGGRLHVSVWSGGQDQPAIASIEVAMGRHFGDEHYPAHSLSFGGLDELQSQASAAGFSVEILEQRVFPWRFDSIRHLAYTHVAGAGRTDENGQLAMGLVVLEDPSADEQAEAFVQELALTLAICVTDEGVVAPVGSDLLVARIG